MRLIYSTSRKSASLDGFISECPCFTLMNDGVRLYAFFDPSLVEPVWLRYKDFSTMSPIAKVCDQAPSLLRLRTYGHSGRVLSVELKQSLKMIEGSDSRYDWGMTVTLFPFSPLKFLADSKTVYCFSLRT